MRKMTSWRTAAAGAIVAVVGLGIDVRAAYAACTPATPCASTPTDLGTLGGASSTALGVSADGSFVVGDANIAGGTSHAFRWTSSGGMTDLGTLFGGFPSIARGVSADGSVVVGDSSGIAFRWTAAGGMQNLKTLLTT